jgi:hypothetical protein
MPPPRTEWDQHMQFLEAEIRRLEAEFNMFFAGRLARPPWETKTRVAALIKRHDQSFIRNTADRFRFETLQSRYQKFTELCDRQLTNRELGRPMFGVSRAAPEPPKPAEPSPAAPEASGAPQAAGAPHAPQAPQAPQAPKAPQAPARAREAADRVVKFGRDAGDARVKELYEELAAAKRAAGEAPVEFERVKALVKAQVTKFADGGAKVAFKIATKDGKVSLTVKAEKDGEGSS